MERGGERKRKTQNREEEKIIKVKKVEEWRLGNKMIIINREK